MKRFTVLLSTLVATFLAVSTAHAQNGAMHFEYPLVTDPNAPNMYTECIDDRIGIDATVYETFQFLVTPNGHVHIVSNWRIEGAATGQDSGWNWYVHGTSPLEVNTQGEQLARTIGVNIMLEPLDGGPRLLGRERISLVANANGDIQVAELESEWSCLGQPE